MELSGTFGYILSRYLKQPKIKYFKKCFGVEMTLIKKRRRSNGMIVDLSPL